MRVQTRWAMGMVTLAVGALVLLTRDTSAQAPAAGYKPVSSVHGLMNGQNIVFARIQDAINNEGTKKRSEQIEVFSEVLAELANVNTFNAQKDDYRKWAGELRDTALELAKEGKKKGEMDAAKMKALVEKMKATCEACHKAYQ